MLGPEGRGWLARCLAEYDRARGRNSPAAWEAVLDAFGPGYVYETARTQWRLAESLAAAGRREDAATVVAGGAPRPPPGCAPRPLAAALDDLARRARLDVGPAREHAQRPPDRSPP